MRSSECGVRSAEFEVRSSKCGVRSAKCGVRSAECGVDSVQYGSGSDRLKKRFTHVYAKWHLAVIAISSASMSTTAPGLYRVVAPRTSHFAAVDCGRYRSRTVPSASSSNFRTPNSELRTPHSELRTSHLLPEQIADIEREDKCAAPFTIPAGWDSRNNPLLNQVTQY